MKKIASIMIVSMLLFSMILFAPLVHAVGTTLAATVTATAHWTRTFTWTIDKSVTPDTWDLFSGDSGTSEYTITVAKDAGTDAYYIDGIVTVNNGGAVATQDLVIKIELRDGVEPPKDLIATADVDVSSNPVLDPTETGNYPYEITIPPPIGDGTYKITAVVTITNHAGHEGTPYGPSPSATTVLPSSATLINDTINVDDTNGGSWPFSASGSVTYDKTFTAAGTYTNTATIRETGQHDSASVTVNCYELEVSKDAQTYFTRTYTWTIEKIGDKDYLELKIGETFDVHYTITVDATYTDSDWMVKGINGILVHNPAPIPATINDVTDVVSPDIPADVDFPVTFPYTLAAGGDLIGTYKADLTDASSRTNTATATLQNYDYKWDGSKTEAGTTDFFGTADVDFSKAIITEVDKSIKVYDDGTYLGTVTYGIDTLPKTLLDIRTIGPYDTSGRYYVDNIASFVTSDTGKTGSAIWEVVVDVIAPSATISGVKYYDGNLNGERDFGESGLSGWTIQLWKLDGTWTLVQSVQTGDFGAYIFEVTEAGTYRIMEVLQANWVQTSSPSYYQFDVVLGGLYTDNDFGNVALVPGHGGLTLGFWSNKNGQKLITASDIDALNLLHLFKPTGWTYPPFTSKAQIANYLLSATAVDMGWMLSAQLIATELDVMHSFLTAGTIVYVGPSTYVPTGFITIGSIMSNAYTALLGTNRAAQEYWKNLLDGINNNRLPFLSP